MVMGKSLDFLESSNNLWYKGLVIIGLILFFILLLTTIFYPMFFTRKPSGKTNIHSNLMAWDNLQINDYGRIALALDFSELDTYILRHALKQANQQSHFLLIHVVESAGAKILGGNIDDQESQEDKIRLTFYADKLGQLGHAASIHLGYRNRTDEIARICLEEKADLLIMGAHGHTGLADFIYGQTIEGVRHRVRIPVLIVTGKD